MERVRSWETITLTGTDIRQRWQWLADKHGLAIKSWGLPALTGFTFKSPNAQPTRPWSRRRCSRRAISRATLLLSAPNTPEIVDGYFEAFDRVLGLIKECEEGRDV